MDDENRLQAYVDTWAVAVEDAVSLLRSLRVAGELGLQVGEVRGDRTHVPAGAVRRARPVPVSYTHLTLPTN